MIKQFAICLVIWLLLAPVTGHGQSLVTYPEPAANFEKKSDLYQVSVTCNGVTKNSFVYVSRASAAAPQWEWQGQEGKSFHFTTFSFSGKATVSVTKFNSDATSATIRPDRAGLGTISTVKTTRGRKVTFTISQPRKISVGFNDDLQNQKALMVFADVPELAADVPNPASANVYTANPADSVLIVPAGKNVVYFAPGVYNIKYWRVPLAVKQVYMSGGAYVRGYILANRNNQAPLKINGRGIISNDQWAFHYPQVADPHIPVSGGWYKTIVINGGKKHLVEGITMIDGTAFNLVIAADSSLAKNVKINGFRYNNDAITIAGKNVVVKDCFIRVGDDGIVTNGSNYTIQNCVFWHLRGGSCIQLGWRPHAVSGNNLIENCDVIHAEWKLPQTQNSGFVNYMGTSSGAPGLTMENFIVQNIYFDTEVLKIIDIRMDRGGKKYPLNISNFVFKNIHAKIPANYPGFSVFLSGCDSANKISGFKFDNFYINGTLINQSNYQQNGYFKTGGFVDPLVFK